MRWYRVAGRHTLPWRLTRDPYAVLIAEVMLQQTQVDRVLPYYAAWLERWPTPRSLAQASIGDVIRAWGGLGYNRRAVSLHRATVVIEDGGGHVPRERSELLALPGVGTYTASAIASFAFEERVPVADTNIARVLARAVQGVASPRELGVRQVAATTLFLLPLRGARDHNLALMDLGALICTARGPACPECPVRESCAWREAGYPASAAPSRPAPRFEGTARFGRGRIIDALRTAESLSEAELAELLPEEHRPWVPRYLSALQREGMAEQTAVEDWRLPVAKAK